MKNRLRRLHQLFLSDYNALPLLLIGSFVGIVVVGIVVVGGVMWWFW